MSEDFELETAVIPSNVSFPRFFAIPAETSTSFEMMSSEILSFSESAVFIATAVALGFLGIITSVRPKSVPSIKRVVPVVVMFVS